jgi:hypothetical protein
LNGDFFIEIKWNLLEIFHWPCYVNPLVYNELREIGGFILLSRNRDFWDGRTSQTHAKLGWVGMKWDEPGGVGEAIAMIAKIVGIVD